MITGLSPSMSSHVRASHGYEFPLSCHVSGSSMSYQRSWYLINHGRNHEDHGGRVNHRGDLVLKMRPEIMDKVYLCRVKGSGSYDEIRWKIHLILPPITPNIWAGSITHSTITLKWSPTNTPQSYTGTKLIRHVFILLPI